MTVSSAISSITRGPRETNMELLRLLAMWFVLTVHADFVALGAAPHAWSGLHEGLSSVMRTFVEMGAVVGVNVFVLISGWFGIRPTVRGVVNFLYQVIFIGLLCFVVYSLLTQSFRTDYFISVFCLKESLWFVKAYLGLYLIVPLLNLYCKHAGERQLRYTIVLFYIYQTVYGFLGNNVTVSNGYTVFAFIGLYLLARYMRLHYRGERHRAWLGIYLLTAVLNTFAYYFCPEDQIITSYANPLVVIGALGLMMYFTRLEIKHDPRINWVAASAFAVYVFHFSGPVFPYYLDMTRQAYEAWTGVWAILAVAMVMAGYFIVAVVIDQLRVFTWRRVGPVMISFFERSFTALASRTALKKHR